jgi:hypothetical protein
MICLESAPVVPQRNNTGPEHQTLRSQRIRRKRPRSGIALSCKYEPVHAWLLNLMSRAFGSPRRCAKDCDKKQQLPHFELKHFELRFQALTARYKIQGQWNGLREIKSVQVPQN